MVGSEHAATIAAVAGAALVAVRVRGHCFASRRSLEALRAENELLRQQLITHEKLSSLGMLAAGIAHEINNPMSFVTANLQALSEDLAEVPELPERLREYALDVVPATLEGVQRVNAIVADLRQFSREDPGRPEEFDLNAQVEAALRIAGGQLLHRIEVVKSLGRLAAALGRPRQITQVLVNLLVNAAQAIPGKGTVTITTRCDPDELTVEVRDTGTGIRAEDLARLFQPFFTTKPVGVGTGLGLAVAHGIVRAHGGRIAVKSTLGVGTTFKVHLPRVPPLARGARRSAAASPPSSHAPAFSEEESRGAS